MKYKKILIIIGIVSLIIFFQPSKKFEKTSEENLVFNPGFELGSIGWDLRPTTGLFNIDNTIVHSGSASVRSDPGGDGMGGFYCDLADGNDNDRSYWQNWNHRIQVTPGDTLTLSGWVRYDGCTGVPNYPCHVNPHAAGSLIGCCSDRGTGMGDQCGMSNKGWWSDRGGARLGIDFRDSAGNVVYDCMIIYDWTMPANTWQYLEQEWIVPPKAVDVIVWMQGHECNAPGTVWLDDVSLIIS